VVFNGRYASTKGAVLAASEANIPVYYHERGATKDLFSLHSFQPHDRIALQRDIVRIWDHAVE